MADPKFLHVERPLSSDEKMAALVSAFRGHFVERWIILPLEHQKITSHFGRRILKDKTLHGGEPHDHNGVDLVAPVGTPCLCPAPGYVLRKYWADLGGWQIVIDHGHGILSGWAHLSGYPDQIMMGTAVSMGTTIAYTGRSGISGRKDPKTGEPLRDGYDPHLHFNVRLLGEWIDPEEVLLLETPATPAGG